jgi:hypothetical protein
VRKLGIERLFKTLVFIVVLMIFLTFNACSRSDLRRINIEEKCHFFLLLGSTPAIGFMYERVLSNKLTGQIDLGVVSLGAGVKYYP